MTDKLRDALQRSVLALENCLHNARKGHVCFDGDEFHETLAAARAALAAPSQTDAELEQKTGEPHIDGWPLWSGLPPEPVAAYQYRFDGPYGPVWRNDAAPWNGQRPKACRPLYTSPQPERKPLTDEQIIRLGESIGSKVPGYSDYESWGHGYRVDRESRRTIPIVPQNLVPFARAIERAHNIGEKK